MGARSLARVLVFVQRRRRRRRRRRGRPHEGGARVRRDTSARVGACCTRAARLPLRLGKEGGGGLAAVLVRGSVCMCGVCVSASMSLSLSLSSHACSCAASTAAANRAKTCYCGKKADRSVSLHSRLQGLAPCHGSESGEGGLGLGRLECQSGVRRG